MVSTRFSLTVENDRALRGMGRLNPSRETRFSGANGNKELKNSCFADHEQEEW